jgi:hypothetical protein
MGRSEDVETRPEVLAVPNCTNEYRRIFMNTKCKVVVFVMPTGQNWCRESTESQDLLQ